ncbi:unnamed protein product [Pneumocystis jirovecii]|uniref:RNA helicase n=2 Tax=Pneumocystis jirovecii TaxID=42068 RepID=L0PEG9_PNEJI|nr:uncharacterized protein T551_02881 [Pneumocystis jirovecii RU7]KTW27914.1 hypothetical protein T551_02881 [Pneumocystis jirovecii RU7]CCJ30627.1 unnamed protein product [Pneumocystis jirovecii]
MLILCCNGSRKLFSVLSTPFCMKLCEKTVFLRGLSRKILTTNKSVKIPKKNRNTRFSERFYKRKDGIGKKSAFFSRKIALKTPKQMVEGFHSLGLMSCVVDAIHKDVFALLYKVCPTDIQILAIPQILRNLLSKQPFKTFLLAAETGSGKTLAYVAPILHILKMEELKSSNIDEVRLQGKPRCIILVPTAELVHQVQRLLKQMSHRVKFRSSFVISSSSLDFIKKNVLTLPSDFLVATPFQIYKFIQEKKPIMDETRYMVIDEADTLLDVSFRSLVLFILNAAIKLKLLIFCSSVVSQKFNRFLSKYYPDFSKIETSRLHTISKKILFKVIDAQKDFKNNKKLACLSILEKIAKDKSDTSKKIVIFFNERKQSDEFAEYLRNKGFSAFSLTKYAKDRLSTIHNFIYGTSMDKSYLSILVTTDLNSRGVDTIGLKNVILFDVPYNSADFIHRLGRVGRGGKRGKAYLILGKEKNCQWINEIKESIRIGKALI